MVLDASLLNTQHYKVQIKSKWRNPGKGVVPSPISGQLTINIYIYIYIYTQFTFQLLVALAHLQNLTCIKLK